MSTARRHLAFFLLLLVAGCVAFRVAGQFEAGRQALLLNEPQRALEYFLEAARGDPGYVYRPVYFSEGIWTYVGRTQYATGNFKEARQSLERALSLDKDDLLARLYLGLTLARGEDVSRGLSEIEAATKAIFDWLEFIEQRHPFFPYWDPTREIRKAIQKDMPPIPGAELSSAQRIANGEWLGQRMEIEADRAREDQRRELHRDSDNGRRSAVGVGIGS